MSSNGVQTKHVWLIAGPAGCGKTSVAVHLARSLRLPYLEGDDYHTQEHIEQMKSGIPLTDADRWDWLSSLRDEAVRRLDSGSAGVVVTCSLLKRKYRDVMRVAGYWRHTVAVHFVYLLADEAILMQRVRARQGHYMKDEMVHSQFLTLERPAQDEADCMTVDVSGSPNEVQENTLHAVHGALVNAAGAEHLRSEA